MFPHGERLGASRPASDDIAVEGLMAVRGTVSYRVKDVWGVHPAGALYINPGGVKDRRESVILST